MTEVEEFAEFLEKTNGFEQAIGSSNSSAGEERL
jgi:hypothetical protein